jgi:hypothetical protein
MDLTKRFAFFSCARGACAFAVVVSLTGPGACTAWATLFTLTDNNSVSQFDTGSQAGNYSWTVDGVSQMRQQQFWYRVGNTAESSINTLPITAQGASDTNLDGNNDTLVVRYANPALQIQTRFSLDGGTAGSGASDLSEQISITNFGGTNMDFHFFEYANFDLQGTPGGDTAIFPNVNSVQQTKGNIRMTETVVTPAASHREIGFYPNTLNKLNDGLPTTLSDTPILVPVGPGDMTWAFQWDVSIAPGGTFQISKDKNLSTIPEPASWILFVVGALLLAAHPSFRRKSRSH